MRLRVLIGLAAFLLSACGTKTTASGRDGGPGEPIDAHLTPLLPLLSPSTFPDFGDGRDGILDVSEEFFPTTCMPVLHAFDNAIAVASVGALAVGDRILVMQVQDDASGDERNAQMVKDAGLAGNWQIAGIVRTEDSPVGALLRIDRAFAAPFASFEDDDGVRRTAQVCHVPQYAAVRVRSGGRLRARPWDGSVGGILTFLVQGELFVEGAVEADRVGFRGGVVGPDSSARDLISDDVPLGPAGGKGEGLNALAFALAGRGSVLTSGGGGNARNAGGGGGGNGGVGGFGGRQRPLPPLDETRGVGGAALGEQPSTWMNFGGAGGAGQQDDSSAGPGGAGGGAIVIGANVIAGTSNARISADGERGADGRGDGAGGGGAGGTLLIITHYAQFDGQISAHGGDGGDQVTSGNAHGPGGGGGGGRVELSVVLEGATLDVFGGSSGRNTLVAIDGEHGATAGRPGVATWRGAKATP